VTTAPNHRRLASEFMIAAAICGAAYYFLADSAHTKLLKVRDEVAKVQSQEAARVGVDKLSDAQVRDLQRSTSERAAEIRAKSAPAFDEATMFSRISELAVTHNVRVEQLNPTLSQGGPTPPALPAGVQPGTPAAAALAPNGDPTAPPPPKDRRIGYNISISGGYPNIAGFLGALNRDLGYTLIRAIHITQPDAQNPQQLRAAIETEHLGFDLAAVKIPALPPQPQNPTPDPAAGKQTAAHE